MSPLAPTPGEIAFGVSALLTLVVLVWAAFEVSRRRAHWSVIVAVLVLATLPVLGPLLAAACVMRARGPAYQPR